MENNYRKSGERIINGIKALIGVFLLLTAIALCSCGESIKGTWYYIPECSETCTYNLDFKDSETVNFDMVNFKYDREGDDITVDVSLDLSAEAFGFSLGVDNVTLDKKELVLGSHEGCRTISEKGDDKPQWARTLEEAEKLREIYYK